MTVGIPCVYVCARVCVHVYVHVMGNGTQLYVMTINGVSVRVLIRDNVNEWRYQYIEGDIQRV